MTAAVCPMGAPGRTGWDWIGRPVRRVSRLAVGIASGQAEGTVHGDRHRAHTMIEKNRFSSSASVITRQNSQPISPLTAEPVSRRDLP
jgi:hypothetical protein